MSDTEQELRTRIREQQEKLKTRQGQLAHVRELLDKADQRVVESENTRRWYRVLDHLENTLDEAKARVMQCEHRIDRLQHKLDDYLAYKAGKTQTGGPVPGVTEDERRLALQASGLHLEDLVDADWADISLPQLSMEGAERVLSISLEDISKMTLEEVAQLHNEILDREDAQQPPSPAEPAQTKPAAQPASREAKSRRLLDMRNDRNKRRAPGIEKQQMLLHAVEKVRAGDVAGLSLEETDLVTESYGRVLERLNAQPGNDRLKESVRATLTKLAAHRAELTGKHG
ncbi:MAG: hypothetical protein QG656_2687 [Candidatus Hydrogenedentes bacterium]|nr:hypothetical protein [Candidatus Hydrogenedentota bacterium]